MYSSTIFQLMQDYNLSFEETEMLQLKIIGIMGFATLLHYVAMNHRVILKSLFMPQTLLHY